MKKSTRLLLMYAAGGGLLYYLLLRPKAQASPYSWQRVPAGEPNQISPGTRFRISVPPSVDATHLEISQFASDSRLWSMKDRPADWPADDKLVNADRVEATNSADHALASPPAPVMTWVRVIYRQS